MPEENVTESLETMAHLASKVGVTEAKEAVAALLSSQGQVRPSDSLESVIEAAIAEGRSLDELAAAIWGGPWTWQQIQALNARSPEEVSALWVAAGYTVKDVGSFELGAVKVIDGLEFVVTDHAEMTDLPHPEFSCLVGVYDVETSEFLDVMETCQNLMAIDEALPGLVEKAALNR